MGRERGGRSKHGASVGKSRERPVFAGFRVAAAVEKEYSLAAHPSEVELCFGLSLVLIVEHTERASGLCLSEFLRENGPP